MNRVLVLIIAGGCIFLPPIVYAEIVAVDSLEWIVCDSDVIVRGVVANVESKNVSGWPARIVTVDIKQVLKGSKKSQGTQVKFIVVPSGNRPPDWFVDRQEHLFFLVGNDRYLELSSLYPLALRDPDYKFDNPLLLNDDPNNAMFDMDFNVVKGRRQILDAVSQAVKRSPTKKPPRAMVNVPWDSQIYKQLWGGSGVSLDVPADGRLERRAKVWLRAENIETRLLGAMALSYFNTPANIALLKSLQNDPGYWTGQDDKGTRRREFPVRRSAFEILTQWNITVETPVLSQISLWHVIVYYWPEVLGTLCTVSVLPAILMFWRWRRYRGLEPGEPHCRNCRYALTGNPDASKCPECGAKLAEKKVIVGKRVGTIWPLVMVFLALSMVVGYGAMHVLGVERVNDASALLDWYCTPFWE